MIMNVGSVTRKNKEAPLPNNGAFLSFLDHSLSCRSRFFHSFIRKPFEKALEIFWYCPEKLSLRNRVQFECNRRHSLPKPNDLLSSTYTTLQSQSHTGIEGQLSIRSLTEKLKVQALSLAVVQKISARVFIEKDSNGSIFGSVDSVLSYINLTEWRRSRAFFGS